MSLRLSRKTAAFVIIMGAVFALLVYSATAKAGTSFTLQVVPQTSFVSPGQNVVLNYTATNNTAAAATCDIYIEQTAFDAPLGTINAGQSAGGQLSTPVPTGSKNVKLTFDLNCDGNPVATKTVNVKIR